MVFAGKPNSPTVTEATRASIRRFRLLALSKSEVALPEREVSGGRCVGMPSTSDVPCLRYVRGQPSFDAGDDVVPTLLGRNPDELENSEDCGSAGGHGNQHVRLRGASVDASKRSARLRQPVCCCGSGKLTIPRKFSTTCFKGTARILQSARELASDGRRKGIQPNFLCPIRIPRGPVARRRSPHHARVRPRPTPPDLPVSTP